ncbi:MAG: hypothetical protein IPG67_03700 [Acidobacteria bacterium]|nr:hypothetical protein [Acidobacteriota bacterium]MBK7933654.1 hypothetical protein [Acidobacteriota bacterium]
MQERFDKAVLLKLSVMAAVAAIAVFGFGSYGDPTQGVSAASSGPSASHTGAPGEANCTSCHSEFPVNSGEGNISITGIPALYTPGQQIQVTVTTSQANAVIYGFQLTAINAIGEKIGVFTLPNEPQPRSQIVTGLVGGRERKYVEHTESGLFLPMTFGFNRWIFTWTAPASRGGRVGFYAAGNGSDSNGAPSGDYIYTTSAATTSGSPVFDFDGDNKTDVSIYRPNGGSGGEWWWSRSSNGGNGAVQFGTATDVIVPSDFTGDNKTDIAFFRPSTGFWYVLRSDDFSFFAFPFGSGGDVPVPADYDADGRSDPAVFRPSNSTWFIANSGGGTAIQQFGIAGDLPVPADYDGDAKADIAIYRPSLGQWWLARSSAGTVAFEFGTATDKAVSGDYTGDGKADVAFWRPATGDWYILRSENNSYFAFPFGIASDLPVPGDYDGDGKYDAAIFRPSNSTWFAQRSTAGTLIQQFGQSGDIPLPNAFVR